MGKVLWLQLNIASRLQFFTVRRHKSQEDIYVTTPTVHLCSKHRTVYATFPFKWGQKARTTDAEQSQNPDGKEYQRISRNTVMCNLMMRIQTENCVMRQSIIKQTSRNLASMAYFLTKSMQSHHCIHSPNPIKMLRNTRLSLSPPGL